LEKQYFLAMDCGTSGLKVVVYDRQFRPVARAVDETHTIYLRPNWAEQDPLRWWQAAVRCIRRCLEQIAAEQVIGIGATSQCHGLTLVDESCMPLHNCLIWPDLRAIAQAEELNRSGVAQGISAHYTAAKLLWVRQNLPHVFDGAYKLLIPKDFLRTKLTMDFVTDTRGAGSTQMLDRSTGDWDWKLVDYIGFPREKLPEIHATDEVVGCVTRTAALETGLIEGTPVIAGQCNGPITPVLMSLAHQGKIKPEEDYILLYLGTAPSISYFSSRMGFNRGYGYGRRSDGPEPPFRGGFMGAGGGGLLKWYKEQFGYLEDQVALKAGVSPYQLLDQEASRVAPGAEGLVFLPHMMGARGPENNYARGVLYGLSLGHRREHIYRAVLEGITFRLKMIYDAGRRGEDIKIDGIILFGGGAQSRIWRQIVADVFGYPIHAVSEANAATLNIACMTSVGLQVYPTFEDAAKHVDVDTEVVFPGSEHEQYDRPYALFRRVTEAMQPVFSKEWSAY
jgi:sugar (pentulose or hexulose) kinase